jgi:hypothetical protein
MSSWVWPTTKKFREALKNKPLDTKNAKNKTTC